MKRYAVYATLKNNPDWKEEYITGNRDETHRDGAIAWAKRNGFDRIRVVEYDSEAFEKPNFVAAINI